MPKADELWSQPDSPAWDWDLQTQQFLDNGTSDTTAGAIGKGGGCSGGRMEDGGVRKRCDIDKSHDLAELQFSQLQKGAFDTLFKELM